MTSRLSVSPAQTQGNDLFDILLRHAESDLPEATRRLARGARLIRQGDAAEDFFLLRAGRLRIERDGVKLASIHPGQTVGEMAFLTRGDRTASVIADRDSIVIRIDRDQYATLCARHPGIAQSIAEDLAQRLERTNARVAQDPTPDPATTIAVLPGGDPSLLPGFVAALSASLAAQGPATVVTSADRPGAITDLDSTDAADWLNAVETGAHPVLFVADPADPDWSRRIVAQADLILTVTAAGTPAPLSDLEQLARSTVGPRQHRLVLLHPPGTTRAQGTAAQLDLRPAFLHHHVAQGSTEDYDRLARFLTGTARGFVAAGGGALGAIHTGVYDAFRAAGTSFDIFGGTSVGSAMTGAFALGLDAEDIDRQTNEIFVKGKALGKLSVPRYGLLDHTHFDKYLRKHFTDVLIEDLWTPYYAVAADLSDNSQKIIRRGPLWQAIRASSAIPGALPPFFDGTGSMLADGGSVDNLPYRAMHELKSGPNVLVTFDNRRPRRYEVDYAALPGRGPLLRRLIWPFGSRPPRAPGVVSIIMRSMMAKQAGVPLDLAPGDLLLQPELPRGVGFMDWKAHRDLFELGRATAREVLDRGVAPTDPRAPLFPA